MTRLATIIGPSDDGRTMSLAEFRTADVRGGFRYELSRGVVTVTNVPNRRHFAMVNAVRQQLSLFEAEHPGVIYSIAAGSDCKVIVSDLESERHPDWAIYKSPMPTDVADDEALWEVWIPDIVVEVVSPDSVRRDYEEKPEEYLRFGIAEYWIIDEEKQAMTAHRRQAGRYVPRVVPTGELYRPVVLNGLNFDIAKVFESARKTHT
jgi:Uma2 family endonuclease